MRALHEDRLKAELTNLSRPKQLAFALLMMERMLPQLLSFSKRARFDCAVYLKAVAAIWNSLVEKRTKSELAEWRSLRNLCLKSAPDTDKYADESASYALNTALAIVAILEFLIDDNSEHLIEVTEFARASIDMYLETSDSSPVSEPNTKRLDSHPLMLREHERQKQDLEFLLRLEEGFNDDTLRKRTSTQAPLLAIAGGTETNP